MDETLNEPKKIPKEGLTAQQRHVMFEKGTEAPFTSGFFVFTSTTPFFAAFPFMLAYLPFIFMPKVYNPNVKSILHGC